MFQKLIQKVQYRAERAVVWAIGLVLVRYSVVIAKEFLRIEAESKQFRSDVKFVADDHWRKLNELHTRLSKLERA